ncbi:MAG: hypothetical protein ABSE48_20685 [Verrucomicrobiota bacterium]|jgi:hypothetical protein
MNEKTCKKMMATAPGLFVRTPAYPKPGNEIFRKLKLLLDAAECPPGGQLLQKEFGALLGMPKSTVNDWSYSNLPPAIRFFLCALERLSEESRVAFLRAYCRGCPRLDAPRIAHDAGVLNALKALVARPTGLTFIRGDSDPDRTYLLTAIGNSARRIIPGVQMSGVDMHYPASYVPVTGLSYFGGGADLHQSVTLRREVHSAAKSGAQLLLFNGVWNADPEMHRLFARWSSNRHVIVADQLRPSATLRNSYKNANIISLSTGADNHLVLQIETAKHLAEEGNG